MKMTYRPLLSIVQDFLENKLFEGHWSWTFKQYMVPNSDGNLVKFWSVCFYKFNQTLIQYNYYTGSGATVRAFGLADGGLMTQFAQNECPVGQTPLLLTLFSDATLVARRGSASAMYGMFLINIGSNL